MLEIITCVIPETETFSFFKYHTRGCFSYLECSATAILGANIPPNALTANVSGTAALISVEDGNASSQDVFLTSAKQITKIGSQQITISNTSGMLCSLAEN